MSGLRTGVYMSSNPASVAALQQLAYFTCVPGNTQHLLADVLEDKPWVARYLKANHEARASAFGNGHENGNEPGRVWAHPPASRPSPRPTTQPTQPSAQGPVASLVTPLF